MFWRDIFRLFPHRRQFLEEQKYKWTFCRDERFRAKQTFKIVPVFSPLCLPAEGGPTERGGEKPHIKSDYIVSLMEQFASQFCQHRALAKLPRAQCLQAAEPSGVIYFTLDAL